MSAISPKSLMPLRTLLQNVFGKTRPLAAWCMGVASLPLGAPVELEVIFEVAG